MSRPKFQKGSVVERRGRWVVRYYEDRIINGASKRVRVSKTIANAKSKTDALKRAEDILSTAGVNMTRKGAHGSLTVGEFIEKTYLPYLDQRLLMSGELHLEQSTVKGYKDIWKFRVQNTHITKIRLQEVTAGDVQLFFESLSQKLSHQSHLRVKAFLAGVFTRAIVLGALAGANPVNNIKVGGIRETGFKPYAYSLSEIRDMVRNPKLSEEAKAICAMAAFTGLRESELRGLQWGDYDGKTITVNRKVWGRHVGDPKTAESRGAVPVISLLRKILNEYKPSHVTPTDFMFAGKKKGFALNLDNLSRRTLAPILNGNWHGWHAFRRGLATRLYAKGEDAKTVQTILRHADVSTTLAHYVIVDSRDVKSAMRSYDTDVLGAFKGR